MKGLSKKEIGIVSDLEFQKKYYFTSEDIKSHFENKKQMVNTIYNLSKKERIIRLNKNKYFLVPIKARTGKWTDNPLIIADEICNNKDYVIGGYYAAYYYGITEQIPARVDIFTTRRQGEYNLLNKRFVFHRTTKDRIKTAKTETIENHSFKIISKDEAKEWMKSKE